MQLRTRVRELIKRTGYDVHRLTGDLGEDPYRDIARLARPGPGAVCLDVGANVGQTIHRLRSALDRPEIHSFEPGPEAFGELSRRAAKLDGVRVNNLGVGAAEGRAEFILRRESDLSSMLGPGADPLGEVSGRVDVGVVSLDGYCASHGLEWVEVLKSDTQGFELEVLRGASGLLAAERVHLILIELNFNEAYEGLPRVDDIYRLLHDSGFRLVSIYNQHYMPDRLAWADALFIAPGFRR